MSVFFWFIFVNYSTYWSIYSLTCRTETAWAHSLWHSDQQSMSPIHWALHNRLVCKYKTIKTALINHSRIETKHRHSDFQSHRTLLVYFDKSRLDPPINEQCNKIWCQWDFGHLSSMDQTLDFVQGKQSTEQKLLVYTGWNILEYRPSRLSQISYLYTAPHSLIKGIKITKFKYQLQLKGNW